MYSRYSRHRESTSVSWIKRFIRFNRKRPQAQTSKTELGRFHKAVDVWAKVLIGIAGLGLGYLLSHQQQQLMKEIENTRKEVSESQINVQKNQFAASLISPLLRGSEKERRLALIALEGVDPPLWQRFSTELAQHDSDDSVRLTAIEGLGRKGDGSVRQTLETIQKEGKTQADRDMAKVAEASLTIKFRDKLKTARAYFDIGRFENAAENFYEASKYVDESQVDSQRLAIAKSHFEHGGYREAAVAFNNLFSKFT
jgi:hypothetical protein